MAKDTAGEKEISVKPNFRTALQILLASRMPL